MGIGMNFVCKRCRYDTGILMLNQGIHDPVETVIRKYIHAYQYEIDIPMLSRQVDRYEGLLRWILSRPQVEITYYYHACVCYHCSRTYELLDILQRKQNKVYACGKGLYYGTSNPLHDMFPLSGEQWSSLIGETPDCLFCPGKVVKFTEQKLTAGLACPKCGHGRLECGTEFELWE